MRCWTGGFDPLDKGGEGRVNVLDMIVMLGRHGRFGEAGDPEWTVLHHSMLVFLIYIKVFGPEGSHHATLHDTPETWTGDLPSPLKRISPEVKSAVKDVERAYEEHVYNFLGIYDPSDETRSQVKVCDLTALVIEAHIFGPPGARCWNDVPEDLRDEVRVCIESVMPDFPQVCARRGTTEYEPQGR